jgi:hypothetical protein
VLEVPTEVWLHPSVRVGVSSIAGHGLFLGEGVVAGTALIRFGGRTVSTAELHRLLAQAEADGTYVDTIAVHDDAHLVLPVGTPAHFSNHSCEPTMWLAGSFELIARHDLEAGTELTNDYGVISDDPSFRMECCCGSTSCRRVVTGEDWQRADLQRVHRGRFPPGLQRRIDLAALSEQSVATPARRPGITPARRCARPSNRWAGRAWSRPVAMSADSGRAG